MVQGLSLSTFGLEGFSGVGLTVVAVLLLLSMWSLAVSLDRWLAFTRARRQSVAFARALAQDRREDWLGAALQTAKLYPHSHLAQVVAAGIQAFQRKKLRGLLKTPEILDAAERALERSTASTTVELRRGIGSLATIATTAPFIGLFGTVIGIIHSFQSIAEAGGGAGGFSIVSRGIAEALVTTALGIVVAIPAAWMFNYLTQRIERLGIEMATSSAELLDFLVDFERGGLAE